MKRFKNILYVVESVDEREQITTHRVQSLARRNNARVCLVRILEESFLEQLGKLFRDQYRHAGTAVGFNGHQAFGVQYLEGFT